MWSVACWQAIHIYLKCYRGPERWETLPITCRWLWARTLETKQTRTNTHTRSRAYVTAHTADSKPITRKKELGILTECHEEKACRLAGAELQPHLIYQKLWSSRLAVSWLSLGLLFSFPLGEVCTVSPRRALRDIFKASF
jgi:hypothetical protein